MADLTIGIKEVEYGDFHARVTFDLEDATLGTHLFGEEYVSLITPGQTISKIELQAYEQLLEHLTGFTSLAQLVVDNLKPQANAT